MNHRKLFYCLAIVSLMAAGCFRTTKPGLENSADGESGNGDDASAGRGGASRNPGRRPSTPDPSDDPGAPEDSTVTDSRCTRGGYCSPLETEFYDSADLLFVVDNSGSMRQEQAALREQFPKLITNLTSGVTSSGARVPRLRDLHLGVVSTDMGLAGVANNFPGCNTQRHINGGDDGVLQHPSNTGAGCGSSYPQFLSYTANRDDPARLANDFSCIANLGTTGCGFEQQLEAGLKALWPRNYVDSHGNVYPPEMNPIQFLSTTHQGRFGHGDVPSAEGGNAGFLRSDALLAIVIVTDEEDCSAKNTQHFISTNDPSNPLSQQGINLRCFYNKQNLFETERYVKGYHGLKPGREESVVFALIAGVPPELVSPDARIGVDFTDQTERETYYDQILNDPRMTEVPMNENVPAIANVRPSCSRTDLFGERADAYPPRRMVEVAKGFGENATVQSICQDDFGPAMDEIIELTARRTRQQCLPREFEVDRSGKIQCDVLWELPPTFYAPEALSNCAYIPYLTEMSKPRRSKTEAGGRLCKVNQQPVLTRGRVPAADGFYYDDFTEERLGLCKDGAVARIAFTNGATPKPGVKAYLDCSD